LGVRHPGGGLFDIIGHPDNIAYFDRRPEEAALEEIEAGFLERVRATGVVLAAGDVVCVVTLPHAIAGRGRPGE
jgi:hypothetical protein